MKPTWRSTPNFPWSTATTTPSGYFDVETVMAHENGHVLGLGHSAEPLAVMFATYSVTRRSLHGDDIDGITFLYPDALGTIEGIVTEVDGPVISGATVSAVSMGGSSIDAVTDKDGVYEITIAAPGTYDLTASASGFHSETKPAVSVDTSNPTQADFALFVDESPSESLAILLDSVRSEKSGKGGSFKILWTTNHPADSQVEFDCCGEFTNSEPVTDHSMSFRGQKGDTYTYSVTSTDADGISVTVEGLIHEN